MILHLFNDEKIVGKTISYFDLALPSKNKFLVLNSSKARLKYLEKEAPNYYILQYDSAQFWSIVGDIKQYNSILLHFLDENKVDFVLKINHPNIIWVEWGADLYNLLETRDYKLYQNKKDLNKYFLSTRAKLFYPLVRLRKLLSVLRAKKALGRIRKFAGLSVDFDLLQSFFPEASKITFVDFFYYPIDDLIKDVKIETSDSTIQTSTIIGNSGALTGNHKLAFSYALKYGDLSESIFVPLSYGNKKYIRDIVTLGYKMFGADFHPITDFMPLKEYYELLSKCNNFIYCNFRQEAVGNILIALYFGKKVFLHNKNPLLKYYRDMGLIVFDISEYRKKCHIKMTNRDQLINKTIIKRKYNLDQFVNNITQLI